MSIHVTISYSVLVFHLVYVFQFLHLFFVVLSQVFIKCSRKAFVYPHMYIKTVYNIYFRKHEFLLYIKAVL